MKRRLLTIAIFLLAGAVVNVAVAWGCVLFGLPALTPSGLDDQAASKVWRQVGMPGQWPGWRWGDPDGPVAMRWRSFGYQLAVVRADDGPPGVDVVGSSSASPISHRKKAGGFFKMWALIIRLERTK